MANNAMLRKRELRFSRNSIARQLRAMYCADPAARAILEHLRSQESTEFTTVDELEQLSPDGQRLKNRDITRVLKRLKELRLGRFIIGRRGHPSRLEWNGIAYRWYIENPLVWEDPAGESEEDETSQASAQRCSFTVRPGHRVVFDVPADLKSWEAKRFAKYVESLAYEPPDAS